MYPDTCGEISSGWFMWALRGAAADGGHFSSPTELSKFFGQLADEIEEACERGTIQCTPQLISEMPPVTWARIREGFRESAGAALLSLFMTNFPDALWQSTGTPQQLAQARRFLHYPLEKGLTPMPSQAGTMKLDLTGLPSKSESPMGPWPASNLSGLIVPT